MRQPTQRELQAEERRNQLVDVSLRLIAKKGFERTTPEYSRASDLGSGIF